MARQVPVYSSFFRVLGDTTRSNVFRIVHLQQIDEAVKGTFANVLEENGKFYKAAWIRDTDGQVSEYNSSDEVELAVKDLLNEIDFSKFAKAGPDVQVQETQHGFKRCVEEASE